MPAIAVRTFAKVNLFLRVLGRRTDGWHELETIFHGISLADQLHIAPRGSGHIDVDMRLEEPAEGELPEARDNLARRAAVLLRQGARGDPGARLDIVKRIPLAAGLGGGSANAAGALVALDALWGAKLGERALSALALELGSDVPYFLTGGTALATGRGERLTPLSPAATMWFALGITHEPMSTADVYREWDRAPSTGAPDVAPMTAALRAGDVATVGSLVHNDLEPAALRLRPDLADKKLAMAGAGALGVLVSGSGPSLFALASSEDHARRVAGEVSSCFDRVVVVSSALRSIEWLGT
jgi:4-diphosphocytidyl-2-C-methyl-D-erythritol kinase